MPPFKTSNGILHFNNVPKFDCYKSASCFVQSLCLHILLDDKSIESRQRRNLGVC